MGTFEEQTLFLSSNFFIFYFYYYYFFLSSNASHQNILKMFRCLSTTPKKRLVHLKFIFSLKGYFIEMTQKFHWKAILYWILLFILKVTI